MSRQKSGESHLIETREQGEFGQSSVLLENLEQYNHRLRGLKSASPQQAIKSAGSNATALPEQLESIACAKMPWWMKAHFHQDMEHFKARAANDNLSQADQINFYKQVGRLLDAAPAVQTWAVGWHVLLAEQLMSYAANPQTVDQGRRKTCGAAVLQSQMFCKDPADAAKLIVDVFLTGSFRSGYDGRTVRPHNSLLMPDIEANQQRVPSGQRTYASQLFQGTAISLVYAGYRQTQRNFSAYNHRQVEIEEEVIYSAGGRSVRDEFDGLTPAQIVEMNRHITGGRNRLNIIERRDIHPFDGQNHVGSEDELKELLSNLKKEHRLPAIAFVNTDHQPFWTDGHYGKKHAVGGGHFVCLTDYMDAPNAVAVDNQWGNSADHDRIPVQQLFLSLQTNHKAITELENSVKHNQVAPAQRIQMELEIARRQYASKQMNDETYCRRVEQTMTEFDKYSETGKISPQEQTRILDQMNEMHNFYMHQQLERLKAKRESWTNMGGKFKSSSASTFKELLHQQLSGYKAI